jgi:tyrosine aminotransferase
MKLYEKKEAFASSMVQQRDENDNMVRAKKTAEQQLMQFNASKYFVPEHHLDEDMMMMMTNGAAWNVNTSEFAKSTSNPVRKLIEQMRIEPNPELTMIALSIGDPTIHSDIGKPESVARAIINCVNDKRFDGYTPSYGTETCRAAIAKYYSRADKGIVYTPSDIYLSNGCSQAIDLCITVLASRGQNILIPKPGFSIYKTLSGTLGIDVKYYQLIV